MGRKRTRSQKETNSGATHDAEVHHSNKRKRASEVEHIAGLPQEQLLVRRTSSSFSLLQPWHPPMAAHLMHTAASSSSGVPRQTSPEPRTSPVSSPQPRSPSRSRDVTGASLPNVPIRTRTPRPSFSYLVAARAPSAKLSTRKAPRKLLVLDLNGALLLRGGHRSHANRFGANGAPIPQIRPVYPRTFLKSFKAYIFHPSTREWLDAMVWSSAQPHSVNDMVSKAFGEVEAKNLVAVWDRAMMGLSREAYRQKSATLKDLSKPWNMMLEEHSKSHGPDTTLLIDDSRPKAALQPFNHVCISEYNTTARLGDLIAVQNLRITKKKPRRRSKPSDEQGEDVEEDIDSLKGFDPTLLAVIGILDSASTQSNIAGWIRSGALWCNGRPTLVASAAGNADTSAVIPAVDAGINEAGDVIRGSEVTSSEDDMDDDERRVTSGELWFEDDPTLSSWTGRGVEALKKLGITLEHGIESQPAIVH